MSELRMNNAVYRQQQMLADTIPSNQDRIEYRAAQLSRYLSLLRDPSQIKNEPVTAELATLATRFYLTTSYAEASEIIDAGGLVYEL